MQKKNCCLVILAISFCFFLSIPHLTMAADPFIFGQILVGPSNDHGWSQASYEAGRAIEKNIPGSKMIFIDKVNPADRPGITIPMLVDDLVSKGAQLVIANSDDMKDGIREAALMHPNVYFVHMSGDDVLTGKAPQNLSNLMGKMEYCKMMVGFAAAMTSQSGKIAYLGPLINEETRRLVVAAYLGARYAWTKVRKMPEKDLQFSVAWIGFWFNIPGVTADPTLVTKNFFNSGHDVVISGLDTTEALTVASQYRKNGANVWATPYDYEGACKSGPEACLGVPYFNWLPGFTKIIKSIQNNNWKQEWLWLEPDIDDLNNSQTSSVGFLAGPALSKENKEKLDDFANQLMKGKLNLFTGPLFYQDGTTFLKDGQQATDKDIWYMPQLLKGITGKSN